MTKLSKTQDNVIDMTSKKWEIMCVCGGEGGEGVFWAPKGKKSLFLYVMLALNWRNFKSFLEENMNDYQLRNRIIHKTAMKRKQQKND